MIGQNILIHVVHLTTVMAIHASNKYEIEAFSWENAVLHYQLLTYAESLAVIQPISSYARMLEL